MKSNSIVLHITHADCLLIKCHFFTVILENCCCVVIEIILSFFFGRRKPLSVCMQNSREEFKALMTDPQWRVSSTESQGSVARRAMANVTSDSHPLVVVDSVSPYFPVPLLYGLLVVPPGKLHAIFPPAG